MSGILKPLLAQDSAQKSSRLVSFFAVRPTKATTSIASRLFQLIIFSCLFNVSDLVSLCLYVGLFCTLFQLRHNRTSISAQLLFILITTSGLIQTRSTIPQSKLLALASNINNDNNNKGEQPSSYRLIGSGFSYAQYLPWYPCLDGSLVFEFKTHEPNGLLFYTQALPYKYIQINLVEGYLRMRMRIGEKDNPRGVFLVYKQKKLNDEKWHEIRIHRQNEQTLLTIDNEEPLSHVHKEANLEGFDLYFGSHSNDLNMVKTDNLLCIGGLPSHLQTYDLSLGTALFEQPYNGYIRNVRAINCSASHMSRLNIVASQNLRFLSEKDACMSSPCANFGVCLLADDSNSQYKCDCSFTGFEGKTCGKVQASKAGQEITFTGKEHFSFRVPPDSESTGSVEEELNIEFKTSRSTGLMVYAGNAMDYFVIGIQDAGVYFKLNIRGEVIEKTLTIPGTVLNNNMWHSVKFTRRTNEIEVLIDNIKRDTSKTTGKYIAMETGVIYVGGTPSAQNTIYRTISKDFIGCLRNVTFNTHKHSLDLIAMAIDSHKQISFVGELQTPCKAVNDPITFSSPDAYIPITNWNEYPNLFTFSIEFQTIESNGVLAYILGSNSQKDYQIDYQQNQSPLITFSRDFFALEIHNRLLNAYFNFGSKYTRFEIVKEHVSNGKPHHVSVEIHQKFIVFKFDHTTERILNLDNTASESLDLQSPLIIGGLHPAHKKSSGLPPYFFSGMLGHGFVGCVQEVEVNGQLVNLTEFASLEGVSGLSAGMCAPMPDQCEIGHCMNDGVCVEGWNRFYCDCSSTGFGGPICNQPATIAKFEDGQYISIKFEPEWISEAEHISLRFRTSQMERMIILSTFTPFASDLMELTLENSQVKLFIKIGASETILYSRQGMNDNQWHTVKILREGHRIIFQVDSHEPSTGMLSESNNENSTNQRMFLVFTYLEIGTSIYSRHINLRLPFIDENKMNSLAYEKLNLGRRLIKENDNEYQQRSMSPFEGEMEQLVINGKSYFELVDNGDLSGSVTQTVLFKRNDLPHKYPLTFHDTGSWLKLPKIDAFHSLLVQFHFKTTERDGLILYNAGQNNDHFAVELKNGQVHYHFSLGQGNNVIRSNSKLSLNDNKWHLVSIWRSTKTNHELSVDSLVYKFSSSKNEKSLFNLVGNLYVGGVDTSYAEVASRTGIAARNGFKGCLASLEINGRIPDINDIVRGEGVHGHVSQGCESVSNGCRQDTCRNDGLCIEKWSEKNQQFCDCEMTTFVGPKCEDASLGYLLNRSQLFFDYTSPLYAEDISLVFGFETKSDNGLLFKSISQRSRKRIIIEIKNGYVQGTFGDGYGVNAFHRFSNYQVNNEKYHIVKLLVIDNNSTLIVDRSPSHKKIISEKSLNYQPISHSSSGLIKIQIGGSNNIDLTEDTKDHILKRIPGLIDNNGIQTEPPSNHLFEKTTTARTVEVEQTTTLPMTRDHLFKVLQTVTKPYEFERGHLLDDFLYKSTEPEASQPELPRDHLLNAPSQEPVEIEFVGKIFGLVYNQVRVLDLVAQRDVRTNSSGEIVLLENSVINKVDDASIGCDEKNLKDCGYTDSSLQHIRKISHKTAPNSDYYDYTITNLEFEPKSLTNQDNNGNKMSSSDKIDPTSSDPTQSGVPIINSDEKYSVLFDYSSSLLTTLIITLVAIVCVLIIAVCKYRNRDEGTYTIDESKNCGPFAELDVPLNSSQKFSSKKKAAKNRRPELSNKEWFV